MDHSLQRILYVDDDPDMWGIAKLALETVGKFTLKICGSGAEALSSAADFGPDLILLDVVMPEMDGPATFADLRKISGMESVPIVFMTGDALPDDVARYKKMGAADVIPKPFKPMTLAQTVSDLWDNIRN